jgi:alpha-glucuronidase
MSRVTDKAIVNYLFKDSKRLRAKNVYDKLRPEDKARLKTLIRQARKSKPTNVSPEERFQHFMSNMPSDIVEEIDLQIAHRFSKTKKHVAYLTS